MNKDKLNFLICTLHRCVQVVDWAEPHHVRKAKRTMLDALEELETELGIRGSFHDLSDEQQRELDKLF